MFAIRHIFALAALSILGLVLTAMIISAGRLKYERVILISEKSVDVSTNLPARLTNAVLDLKIFEPADPLATNYRSWSGNYSLRRPAGFSSGEYGINETWEERRLVAIKPEGFEMLFTKRWRQAGQKINRETNVILFPFGKITETNTLECRIVGNLK